MASPKPEPAPQPVQQAAPQPAQTHTAALPPAPAVSEAELNAYIDGNERPMFNALDSYNNQYRVIRHHSGAVSLARMRIIAWRVAAISGNEAEIIVSYQSKTGNGAGSGSTRFLTKWTGSALQFIGYEKDREMIRTGG